MLLFIKIFISFIKYHVYHVFFILNLKKMTLRLKVSIVPSRKRVFKCIYTPLQLPNELVRHENKRGASKVR